MLRRTPLKAKTALKSKTPLRAKTALKAGSSLRAVSLKNGDKTVASAAVEKKHRTKRKPNYVADMDRVFQYYVRLRDAMPRGYTRCISCGKIKPFDQMQGGHYMSRRHYSLRWNECNVNAECIGCNGFDGDHLIGYRKNLINKIGQKSVELLEGTRNVPRRWSDFEIEALIRHYSQKVIQLASAKKLPISEDVKRIIRKYQKSASPG